MKRTKEINNNNQLKGIIFFGFYFIFFLIIIIMIRGNNKATRNNKVIDDDLFISSQNNYSYTYTITHDNVVYKYVGDKTGNSEKFEYNGISYNYDGEKYYSYQFNNWVEVENPYRFMELLDYKRLLLLKDSMMLTDTIKYASGKVVNHYIVSSNSINKILYDKDTDFFENGNMISVSKDKLSNVERIVLVLNDYCKNNGLCNENLKIDLEYDYYSNYEKK